MDKKIVFLFSLVGILFVMVLYLLYQNLNQKPVVVYTPTSTNIPQPTPGQTAKVPDTNLSGSIIIKPNPSDPNKSDIYSKDYTSGAEKYFMTINDRIYKEGNFYSFKYEYKQGYIYLIKDTQNISELWKYDSSGNGTKLYSDFSGFMVSNNSQFIALTTNKNSVIITDINGRVLREYTGSQIIPSNDGNLSAETFKWSPDDKLFFGRISLATQTQGIYKINVSDWSYKIYDTSKLPIGMSMDINSSGDKLTFDNVPFMFDVDTANAFEKSKTKVSLYVYNLEIGSTKIINTSIAKSFHPTWKNSNTVEYDDPNGTSRLTYSLN